MKRLFPYTVFVLALSACQPAPTFPAGQSATDSLGYQVFPLSNGGWGFDIRKGSSIFIHQPFIPARDGLQSFGSEAQARALATLIVIRIKTGGTGYILEQSDVAHILDSISDAPRPDTALDETSTSLSALGNPGQQLPWLPDRPLLARWLNRGTEAFGPRSSPKSFAIGDKVYIGLGEYADHYYNDLWVYDTRRRYWTALAFLPTPDRRVGGVAFSIGGRGYYGLGIHAEAGAQRMKREFFAYNPLTNRWRRMVDFPGDGRLDAMAFTVGDKAYVGLGYAERFTRDVYAYDGGKDHWDRVADFPGGPTSSAAGFSDGYSGFVAGGDGPHGNQKTFFEYQPATDTWVRRPDLPETPRYFMAGCFVDSGYCVAGAGASRDNPGSMRDFHLYDARRKQWSGIDPYPTSLDGFTHATAANVHGNVYVGGGYGGNYSNTWNEFEFYYPVNTEHGTYDEFTAYSVGTGHGWTMFEECDDKDCYAGVALKADAPIQHFRYTRRLKAGAYPRSFTLSGDVKGDVLVRFFFTREEVTGDLNQVAVLQKAGDSKKIIHPSWYQYGFQGQTLVAECVVAHLQGDFSLTRF